MNPESGRQAEQSSTIRPSIEAVLQHDKQRFAHLDKGFRDQGQDNSIKVRRQKALDRLADTTNPLDDKQRRDITLQVAWSDFWLPNRDETKRLLPTELSAQVRTMVQAEILANDQDPTNSEAHALIARTLTKDARFEPDKTIRNKLYEDARKSFEEALINDPDNALANLFLNVPREDLEATQLALAQKGQKQSLTTEEHIRHSEITDAIRFQQELDLVLLSTAHADKIRKRYTRGLTAMSLGFPPGIYLARKHGPELAEMRIESINGKRANAKGRRRGEPPQTGTGNQQPERPMRLLNHDGARHDKRQEILTKRFNGAAVDGQLRVSVKRAGEHYIILGGDASQSFSAVFTHEAAEELLTSLQTSPDAARTALSAIGIDIDLNQETQIIGDNSDPAIRSSQLLESTGAEAQSRKETERARTELENRIEQHISQLITLQEETVILGAPGEKDRSRYSSRRRNEATGIYDFGREPTYELAIPVTVPDAGLKTHAAALVYAMETKVAAIAQQQKKKFMKWITPDVKPKHPSPVPIILHETRTDEAAGTQEFIIQIAEHTSEKPNLNDVAVTTLVFKDQSAYKAILDLLQENNNANLKDALQFLIQRTDPRSTWNQPTLSSGNPQVVPPQASPAMTGGLGYGAPEPARVAPPAPTAPVGPTITELDSLPAAASVPAPRVEPAPAAPTTPEPAPVQPELRPSPEAVAKLFSDPVAFDMADPDSLAARQARAIIDLTDRGIYNYADLPIKLDVINAIIDTIPIANGGQGPQDPRREKLLEYRKLIEELMQENSTT